MYQHVCESVVLVTLFFVQTSRDISAEICACFLNISLIRSITSTSPENRLIHRYTNKLLTKHWPSVQFWFGFPKFILSTKCFHDIYIYIMLFPDYLYKDDVFVVVYGLISANSYRFGLRMGRVDRPSRSMTPIQAEVCLPAMEREVCPWTIVVVGSFRNLELWRWIEKQAAWLVFLFFLLILLLDMCIYVLKTFKKPLLRYLRYYCKVCLMTVATIMQEKFGLISANWFVSSSHHWLHSCTRT